MDRIDALRVFVAVVDQGSFTQAANKLNLSPQLASKYVAQLEQKVGVRLLNRTTRRVSATEAGEGCYQHAVEILSNVDDMEQHLGDLHQQTRGTLRISAPVSFAIQHLALLLAQFQQNFPLMHIDLQLNDRKVDIVEEGFDLALRIGHLQSSNLIAKYVAPIRLVLCASPDYLAENGTPLEPADLRGHRYLGYSYMERDDANEIQRYLRGEARGPQGGLSCNNGDLLAEAAVAGAGIVLQPTFIAGKALARGELKQILPEYEAKPLGLYVVYPHRKLLAAKVRCFLDFIDGYFGDPPYWDQFDVC